MILCIHRKCTAHRKRERESHERRDGKIKGEREYIESWKPLKDLHHSRKKIKNLIYSNLWLKIITLVAVLIRNGAAGMQTANV